jgi:O-antigen biosynthesis protein
MTASGPKSSSARRGVSWRRVPAAWRFLRNYGLEATWRRLFRRERGYRSWIKAYDRLRPVDKRAIAARIRGFTRRPRFSVIMPIRDGLTTNIGDALASVTGQLYPDWELCVAADATTLDMILSQRAGPAQHDPRIKFVASDRGSGWVAAANAALAAAVGDFVLLLDPRDRIAPHALYAVAAKINQSEDKLDIIYSDEDFIDQCNRRHSPQFKPDWNPDLFLGFNIIGRLAVYRLAHVRKLGGLRREFIGAEEYDLNLRLIEETKPENICHVPLVLYHRRDGSARDADPSGAAVRAVAQHLRRRGVAAEVVPWGDDHVRLRYPVPTPPPPVSLIVPTRDRLELLRGCIDGITSNTDYNAVELIVVDNESKYPETHQYLAELQESARAKILHYSGEFNYSAINNFAVGHAASDIIGFLNNDVKVIEPDWLREMVSQVVRPEIGVVGAKLLYPNDTIQHAGTIVGLGGLAGHAFRHFDRDSPGYMDRLRLTQNVAAVTGACMLVRKSVFDEIGGFDEVNLPVAYNDVDFCLRALEHGYRNVWTPFAQLYHIESGSRPSDFSRQRIAQYKSEMRYLKRRWRQVIRHDPYYNPNLTIENESFGLAFPPRVVRPWRK